MYDIVLQERLQALGMPRGKARDLTRQIRDHMLPVAVVASRAYHDPKGLSGLGALGATGVQAIQGAATGAKIGAAIYATYAASAGTAIASGAAAGSIVPGIGTVIGAVVGLIIVALSGLFGSRNVRVNGATRAQCVALLAGYMDIARKAGAGMSIGPQMGLTNLAQVSWCLNARDGGILYSVDPRYFNAGFEIVSALAKQLMSLAVVAPPGSTVTIGPASGTSDDSKHRVYTWAGGQITLPTDGRLTTLRDQLIALIIANCPSTAGKYAGGCAPFFSTPEYKQMVLDLLGYYSSLIPLPPPTVTVTPQVVQAATNLVNVAPNMPPSIVNPTMTTNEPAWMRALPQPNYTPAVDPNTMTPITDTSAALVQQQLAAQGVNMTSPQAQGILADVASDGVIKTPQGPSKISPLQAGVGIAGGVLLLMLFLGGKSYHGR